MQTSREISNEYHWGDCNKDAKEGRNEGDATRILGRRERGRLAINWGLVVLASLPTLSDVEWRIRIRALKGLTPVSKTTRYRYEEKTDARLCGQRQPGKGSTQHSVLNL